MPEYINRESAIAFAKHAYHKGLNILEYLAEVPAADVVEVRHGRWKGAGLGDYYCSLCNETYSIGAERVKNWYYCPNCMAKMDGGQDDD